MTQTPAEMWRRRRSARLYDTEPTMMTKTVGDASLAANVSAADRVCSGCGYHVCGCEEEAGAVGPFRHMALHNAHPEPRLEPTTDRYDYKLVSHNRELPAFAIHQDWSIKLAREDWLHGFEGAQAWLSTAMQQVPRFDPYTTEAAVAWHLYQAIEQGRISKGPHGWSYRP